MQHVAIKRLVCPPELLRDQNQKHPAMHTDVVSEIARYPPVRLLLIREVNGVFSAQSSDNDTQCMKISPAIITLDNSQFWNMLESFYN